MATGTPSPQFDSEASTLLSTDDPAPVRIINLTGRSSFLLIGDHAGNRIPASLESLGLDGVQRRRHIAWDIGVAGLGDRLAAALDAMFVAQTYSRLVVDCNRHPDADDAVTPVSDGTPVPGNASLDSGARAARVAAIHAPYHEAIAAELSRRDAIGMETILVALHSFTPEYGGAPPRPWHVGILHDRGDASFAHECLHQLAARRDLVVGDNEPYRMDAIDYTVPRHCYAARRRYVEIEVRQDLISTDDGVSRWADCLVHTLRAAGAAP